MSRKVPLGFYTQENPPSHCPVCQTEVDINHWVKNFNTRNKNGFSWLCRERKNSRGRSYYARDMTDPIKSLIRKESDRLRYLKDPLYIRWKAYRSCDARMYGGMTIDWDAAYLLMTAECHYCADPTPGGLDRKDSSLGHTADNVVPCCAVCNNVLGDLPYPAKLCLKSGLLKMRSEGAASGWMPPTMRRKKNAVI